MESPLRSLTKPRIAASLGQTLSVKPSTLKKAQTKHPLTNYCNLMSGWYFYLGSHAVSQCCHLKYNLIQIICLLTLILNPNRLDGSF